MLSVVIMVKNEEKRIETCLNSLKGLADEIVIVDDISTDRTVEICKNRYNAKIITSESKGRFDKQFNIGRENCSGQWILHMDADEILPIETADKIRESIQNSENFVAFGIKRKNFFLGKPILNAGNYNYKTYLYKKDKGRYTGNRVHETLEVQGNIGFIDADIYHYPFNTIKDFIEKLNLYTELESDVFVEENDVISAKEIKQRLLWKSIKLFWKLYIKKHGYKDGMHGLIWCLLNVIGPQVRWMKIWDKASKQSKLVK